MDLGVHVVGVGGLFSLADFDAVTEDGVVESAFRSIPSQDDEADLEFSGEVLNSLPPTLP